MQALTGLLDVGSESAETDPDPSVDPDADADVDAGSSADADAVTDPDTDADTAAAGTLSDCDAIRTGAASAAFELAADFDVIEEAARADDFEALDLTTDRLELARAIDEVALLLAAERTEADIAVDLLADRLADIEADAETDPAVLDRLAEDRSAEDEALLPELIAGVPAPMVAPLPEIDVAPDGAGSLPTFATLVSGPTCRQGSSSLQVVTGVDLGVRCSRPGRLDLVRCVAGSNENGLLHVIRVGDLGAGAPDRVVSGQSAE